MSLTTKVKHSVAGPSKAKEDPMETARQHMEEYKTLLPKLTAGCDELQATGEKFSRAAIPMMKRLQDFFKETPERKEVDEMLRHLTAYGEKAKEANSHLCDLRAAVSAQTGAASGVKTAFVQRDKARDWVDVHTKSVASAEAAQAKKPSDKNKDKLTKEQTMLEESEKTYEAARLELESQASAVLDSRHENTALISAHLCDYYAAHFEAGAELAASMTKLALKLKKAEAAAGTE